MEQRERVHRYLGGIIRGMDGVAHAVGGTADHVHLFAGLRATHCLADVMREVKADSSAWIHREIGLAGFHWQEGYGAFTISAGQKGAGVCVASGGAPSGDDVSRRVRPTITEGVGGIR